MVCRLTNNPRVPIWRELLSAENEDQLESVTTTLLEIVSYSLFLKLAITDFKPIHVGNSYKVNLN